MNEDDEGLLSAFCRFEQHGGNPLLRAEFTPVGRNRLFCGIVDQKKYKLTLQQLQDAQDEPLGEAINEALIQGLHVPLEEWLSNCPACLQTNKTCPNYAAWIKPTLEYPNCNCKFYGQDYFEAHKKKGKEKDDKSICES